MVMRSALLSKFISNSLNRIPSPDNKSAIPCSDAKDNIQSHHVIRPIPQTQIDRTVGGYAQNPGYPQ
ncbi:MAG: RagB/SusD family nutrient uptake outer membrane protein [Proteobacteria bacterium]|nr:RagB/SusD family nutrient uptake outer membrane protein [Pseudomonadota bacterium]